MGDSADAARSRSQPMPSVQLEEALAQLAVVDDPENVVGMTTYGTCYTAAQSMRDIFSTATDSESISMHFMPADIRQHMHAHCKPGSSWPEDAWRSAPDVPAEHALIATVYCKLSPPIIAGFGDDSKAVKTLLHYYAEDIARNATDSRNNCIRMVCPRLLFGNVLCIAFVARENDADSFRWLLSQGANGIMKKTDSRPQYVPAYATAPYRQMFLWQRRLHNSQMLQEFMGNAGYMASCAKFFEQLFIESSLTFSSALLPKSAQPVFAVYGYMSADMPQVREALDMHSRPRAQPENIRDERSEPFRVMPSIPLFMTHAGRPWQKYLQDLALKDDASSPGTLYPAVCVTLRTTDFDTSLRTKAMERFRGYLQQIAREKDNPVNVISVTAGNADVFIMLFFSTSPGKLSFDCAQVLLRATDKFMRQSFSFT